jgi:hypothetical protein
MKETAVILAKPAGVGEGENVSPNNQTAWPPNKKPQFPYSRELRIAPVLLGPQVSGRPVSRGPVRPSYRQVFWLLDQSTPGAFPGRLSTPVAFSRFRPQLQRRDRDGFAPSSLFPYGTCKFIYAIPFGPGCQGESPGLGRTRRRLSQPPKPGPRGGIWPGGETRCGDRIGDSWSRSVPCPWPR